MTRDVLGATSMVLAATAALGCSTQPQNASRSGVDASVGLDASIMLDAAPLEGSANGPAVAGGVDASGGLDGEAISDGDLAESVEGGANETDAPAGGLGAAMSADAGPATADSLYSGLPVIESTGSGANVGPGGGHIVFPDGVSFDVPAGALAAEVTIQKATVAAPASMSGMGTPIVPVLQFLPEGLGFWPPARLNIPLPSTAPNELVVVSAQSDNPLLFAPTDDPLLEDIAFTRAADGSLQATVWHFSTYAVLSMGPTRQRVGDVYACSGSTSTRAVAGLSKQLRRVFLQLEPESLRALEDTRVNADQDPLKPPYLQPNVVVAILAALHAAPLRTSFIVTSGWRSIAQQYVLRKCNTNATAKPGTSHHGDGSAVDLQPLGCTVPGATRDRVHPVWGALLEKQNLQWYGSANPTNVCGDPPHFEFQGQHPDLRSTATAAFQRLWNNNNPCDRIDEDGLFGAQTEARLAASPPGGFPKDTTAIVLPAEGVVGAGCPVGNGSSGVAQSARLCCPGVGGGQPSCRTGCEQDEGLDASTAEGGPTVPPIEGGTSGWTTRYWDCCKPSCAWQQNVSSGRPMASCDKDNKSLSNDDDAALPRNACEPGGTAYMCYDFAPWAVSDTLAYGYAAAAGSSYACGRCYELQFTGTSHVGTGGSALSNKTMIVQVVSNSGGGADEFHLLIPGGGQGPAGACSSQWGTSSDLGATYGGFLAACKGDATCTQQYCQSVFANKPELLAGCNWFVGWFGASDGPNMRFKQVGCPSALAAKSGL